MLVTQRSYLCEVEACVKMNDDSESEFQPPTMLRVMRKRDRSKSKKFNLSLDRQKATERPQLVTFPMVEDDDFSTLLVQRSSATISSVSSQGSHSPAAVDDVQTQEREEVEPVILEDNTNNRTYLITYAQADKDAFPTRESFGALCQEAFGGDSRVEWYACAEEPHLIEGLHYHVTIKLFKGQRWFPAKEFLSSFGPVVNFSRPPPGKGAMYAWMFRYICKYDQSVFLSERHPSLQDISSNRRCEKAINSQVEKRRQKISLDTEATTRKEGKKTKEVKKSRLKEDEVAAYCRKVPIKTLDELMADAEIRRQEGDNTLNAFIFGRTIKSLNEMLTKAWMMEGAVRKVKDLGTPRLTVLQSFKDAACLENCNGLWFTCALDLLKRNKINKYLFAHAIRELLEKGRGKKRNLFLMGPHTSGKTFLLKPLLTMYPQNFTNPAASSFGWLGADEASVIVLNDFRWESKLNGGSIEWGTLLNLLEGFDVKLPAPMNTFSKNIRITSDVPIFATGPDPIRWYAVRFDEPRGAKHVKEDGQIDCRWKTFELTHTIADDEKVDGIPECPACFTKMAYLGCDE